MSISSSKFLAILALTAGTLQFARAGDKIEFSAPTVSLAVPRLEREDPSVPNSALDAPTPPDAAAMADAMQSSQQVVMIPAQRKKDRIWDSSSRDDRDNLYNRDETLDDHNRDDDFDLDSKPQSDKGLTNFWQLGKEWDYDNRRTLSDNRQDGPAGETDLRSRLETLHESMRSEYDRNDRYDRHDPYDRNTTDSEQESGWTHSFFQHGFMGMGKSEDSQYNYWSDQTKAIVQQQPVEQPAYLRDQLTSAAEDQLRESKLPPGMVEYQAQQDEERGKVRDEPLTLRRYEPVESRAINAEPNPYARQMPPPSPRGDVQSQPAVLPFPKRPGSVFQ